MRSLVLGHVGMVGSAICRVIGSPLTVPRSADLRDAETACKAVRDSGATHVYLCAARVGGILANASRPADFIRDNLQIQTSVIDACHLANAKLLFLGSSCIYPRECPQPIREEYLGTGPLEPTNEAYAWAKLAGIAMVKAYRKQYGLRGICLMPTNLYGPGDNFDLQGAHLVPALMRKMHEAKVRGYGEVHVWGAGTPRRELMHVDDLARACVKLMSEYDGEEIVNVGTGSDMTIREIAHLIAHVVDYQGRLVFDASGLDGTPVKRLDVQRIHAMGWNAEIDLRRGLEQTYAHYQETHA